MKHLAFLLLLLSFARTLPAQQYNPFLPFTYEWPTPSETRLASGAPGPAYWQQRADYKLDVRLIVAERTLEGTAQITYHNNSPHSLNYLWVQTDQNVRAFKSRKQQITSVPKMQDRVELTYAEDRNSDKEQGYAVFRVKDASGEFLDYYEGETNLRIDLDSPLAPGATYRFTVEYAYKINDAAIEGRSGYEYFPEDNSYIWEIAQFFPRMCRYDDLVGWQNRPFYGAAEFALDFGDYEVNITVPDNYLVAATGTLRNGEEVLSKKIQQRLADLSDEIQYIVSPEEAEKNLFRKSKGEHTWSFRAENVRDFAFATSKKFVWDALQEDINGQKVTVQSFYPEEGMPLWNRYATQAARATLVSYSRMSVPYPYPQVTVVHGPVWGMEYPMVAFCGGRPESKNYYSRSMKYRMIGVVMHEVGHNFFPMIVNSDERRWAWMDEGLNSYLQYRTELDFEPNFDHRRGPADAYTLQSMFATPDPIMTNAESIDDLGTIAYGKVAVGLNMLRELVMGPEAFDFAFRTYANRWAFKHPRPADFFRTMQDASGTDLDWFWREWFYGTGDIDFSIQQVRHYTVPATEGLAEPLKTYDDLVRPKRLDFFVDDKEGLADQYTYQEEEYRTTMNDRTVTQLRNAFTLKKEKDVIHIYQVEIRREGIVMPVPFSPLTKGGSETLLLPAQIWFAGDSTFTFEYRSQEPVVAFELDKWHDLVDINRGNNLFPQPKLKQTFEEIDWR